MDHPTQMNKAKEAAAKKAIEQISEGMAVGLGTGSTAAIFIKLLGLKCREGFQIKAAASSSRTFSQAVAEGIPMIDINARSNLDISIDGADEIDPHKRLIKGGGGAALREKILASMSKEFVVIADESKLVESLGRFPLAVETCPFGHRATLAHLEEMGYSGRLRITGEGTLFITDNGNYTIDIALPWPCLSPEKDDEIIRSIPGVLETGFFFNLATRAIIGYRDGHTQVIE